MSSFENQILEVPQHSKWHLFSGTLVLISGSFGSIWAALWLVA